MSTKIKKSNKFTNDKFINRSFFTGGGEAQSNMTSKQNVVDDSNFSLDGEPEDVHSYKNQKKIDYPWKITELKPFEDLWKKEPCFSEKEVIEDNPKKGAYNKNNFTHTFFRGYYSISEIPIFGWRKSDTGAPRKFVLPKTLSKFLYCFFVKICGSPLYVVYLAARIIFMIAKPFITKIPVILIATINTLGLIAMVIVKFGSLGFVQVPLTHEFIIWNYTRVNKDGSTEEIPWYPGGVSLIKMLFGFSLPFNMI